jgi:transcriptional regulator with XRE-family HTH domain
LLRVFIERRVVEMSRPRINVANTAVNLKNLRKKNGLCVKELQKLLGFEFPQAIYKWERGENLPSLDNFVVLSRVYNVPVDDLLVVDEG